MISVLQVKEKRYAYEGDSSKTAVGVDKRKAS
jgi:hypothetical protein